MSTADITPANNDAAPLTGLKVLFWLLGAFAVICVANFALIGYSLTTFTGETQPKSYAVGLDFNKTLEQVAAQHARGLSVRGSVTSPLARTVDIKSLYRDSEGTSMAALTVTAAFSRPTHEGYDFEQELSNRGDGAYGAQISTPLSGVWNVRLTALQDGAPPYILDYRVIVK
ncbi:MAG: FixH family protein [Rhodospirillaceae bacterium]|nr:FixH family protein [Rhodospirillaceae bacterium]